MKIAHNAEVTVFVKPDEQREPIETGLRDLVPITPGIHEEFPLTCTDAEAFSGSTISILKVTLTKNNQINEFLESLHRKLTEDQKKLLLVQLATRLDAGCNFYMRFHKGKWIEERRLWLVDRGYCFHIKITIAAYPKNQVSAAKVVTTWLTS